MPLFDTWSSLGATLARGVVGYVAVVAFLRVSGKRTLSKMNAFDFVVTVALGSTLASVLTSRSTPLADGVAGMALLIGLQYAVAWTATRVDVFQQAVKSSPTLLVYRGILRDDALRAQRVTREEVTAALRGAGVADVGRAGAVVLETDGSFSVISLEALPPDGAIAGAEVGR